MNRIMTVNGRSATKTQTVWFADTLVFALNNVIFKYLFYFGN